MGNEKEKDRGYPSDSPETTAHPTTEPAHPGKPHKDSGADNPDPNGPEQNHSDE